MFQIEHLKNDRFSITCNDLKEEFLVASSAQFNHQYFRTSWKEEVCNLISSNQNIAMLFTVINPVRNAGYWRLWYIYRFDGEYVLSEMFFPFTGWRRILTFLNIPQRLVVRIVRHYISKNIPLSSNYSKWSVSAENLSTFCQLGVRDRPLH